VAASRATTLVWRAARQARHEWWDQLLQAAARMHPGEAGPLRCGPGGIHGPQGLVITYRALAAAGVCPRIAIDLHGEDPAGNAHDTHFVFGASAAIAQVCVDTWSGAIRVEQLVMCTALGPVASPQGYLGQMEGGALMGQAMCTNEDLECAQGRYTARNLDTYLIPTLADAPAMQVLAIENLPEGDPIGPRGAGEIGVNFATPAVANAIATAIGRPVNHLPLTPARVIAWLETTQEAVAP
jgi:CO/xanthine dehydrogenase Mo-binding subunit